MRLPLATAAVVLATVPAAARAEPLDLSLVKLGAPSASIWTVLDGRDAGVTLAAGEADALASEAKQRFATLSIETALAFSSAVLQPASTTGVAGWDVGFEASYVAVHPDTIGSTSFGTVFEPRGPWQTKGLVPNDLLLAGLHVRKALPYSFELGGRFVYLSQSNYGAAQVEGKWAFVEGYRRWPDVAVRAAYTAVLGQVDWNLGSLDLGGVISMRFGLNAVTSVTPYLAGRWTRVTASSEVLDFGPTTDPAPTPAEMRESQAAFPELTTTVHRWTAGARLNASNFGAALEVSYLPAKTVQGEDAPTADQYPDVELAASWGVSVRLGWDF
jgi:hypothetical protein